MLVNFTVECLSNNLMSVRLDCLGGDGGSHSLLYMREVASARSMPGDSSLSSLHCCSSGWEIVVKLTKRFSEGVIRPRRL